MLVGICVDQLDVDPNPVPGPAHAALENRPNPESFSNLTHVRSFSTIRHDRGAGDDLEVTDFGQISQDVILNAVSEIGVLFLVAKIFKWQYRNRFVDFAGNCPREDKKTDRSRNNYTCCREHEHIAPAVTDWCGLRDCRARGATNPGGCDVKDPGQDQREGKSN